MGLKLLLVSGLALLTTIPSLFVNSLVEERTERAKDVMQEISGRAGGQEAFLGPSLSIPFSIPPTYKGASSTPGVYVVFPTKGEVSVRVHTQERHRSLFKVPVYEAELKFDATFDLTGVPSAAPAGAELDWTRAGIVIGVSDPRGALADGTLTANGKTITFVPAETFGEPNPRLPLAYFGARVSELVQPNAAFNVTANLRFSGAQRLTVLAYGQEHAPYRRGRLAESGVRRWLLAGETYSLCAGLYRRVVRTFHCPRGARRRHEHRGQCAGSHRDGDLVHRDGGPLSICEPLAQICTSVCRIIIPLLLCL
jgi:inner membrane protein involved in colicin E2 resistance